MCCTGLLLKLPFWDHLNEHELFDDGPVFELPEHGYPVSNQIAMVTSVNNGSNIKNNTEDQEVRM